MVAATDSLEKLLKKIFDKFQKEAEDFFKRKPGKDTAGTRGISEGIQRGICKEDYWITTQRNPGRFFKPFQYSHRII